MNAPAIALHGISIGRRLEFALAEKCAEIIHHRIIDRHLARIGYVADVFNGSSAKTPDIVEVCMFFRSLPIGDARDELRSLVKHQLTHLMSERGTERRWQNYVRKVAARRGEKCPESNDDVNWGNYVAKEISFAA